MKDMGDINKVSIVTSSHVRRMQEHLHGHSGGGAQAFLAATAKPPTEAAAEGPGESESDDGNPEAYKAETGDDKPAPLDDHAHGGGGHHGCPRWNGTPTASAWRWSRRSSSPVHHRVTAGCYEVFVWLIHHRFAAGYYVVFVWLIDLQPVAT
jgi:hypothetical protein